MSSPLGKERLYATADIEGLVQAGEHILIDPELKGIYVARWVSWEHLPRLVNSCLLVPSTVPDPEDIPPPRTGRQRIRLVR